MSFIKEGLKFINEIYENKFLLYELTKRDFRERYLGSYLGLLWALLDPLIMMLLIWFVFTVGLKGARSTDGYPFVAYLFPGMIVYNFFSITIGANAGVVKAYSFLVRKVNFRVSVLPLVKIASSLIMHLIFIVIVMAILWMVGLKPSVYWLQILFYLPAMIFLMSGLCWLLSALGVFVEDVKMIVSIVLRLLFWLTPIFWNIKRVPEQYHWCLKLNPLFYVVDGYRKSLLYHQPFWLDWGYSLYFWSLSFVLLLLGVAVFRRLRPHFEAML